MCVATSKQSVFGARVTLVHGGEAQTLRFYSHPPLGRREYFGRGGNPTFTDGGVQAACKGWGGILGNAYIQTQPKRSGSTVGRLCFLTDWESVLGHTSPLPYAS